MLPKRTNDSLQDKGWDLDNAFLAQLAERDFCKVQVVGSIPTEGSNIAQEEFAISNPDQIIRTMRGSVHRITHA